MTASKLLAVKPRWTQLLQRTKFHHLQIPQKAEYQITYLIHFIMLSVQEHIPYKSNNWTRTSWPEISVPIHFCKNISMVLLCPALPQYCKIFNTCIITELCKARKYYCNRRFRSVLQEGCYHIRLHWFILMREDNPSTVPEIPLIVWRTGQ